MGQRQAYPCVRLARRCIGILWSMGESVMVTQEEQDFLGMPSGKVGPTTSPPLDTLAKTLADGTVSRKQALQLMGAGCRCGILDSGRLWGQRSG
jgi:hypothetical protein